jgi:Dolichyl-phosphate-mannose-protein mannosyltransferase
MTTPACDPPGRVQTRVRFMWAAWAAWSVLVLGCYYLQIWRSLREPLPLLALAAAGARQALSCAVIGAAAIVGALIIARTGRAARRAIGDRAVPFALLSAALLVFLCSLHRDTWMTALSIVGVPRLPAFGEAVGRAASGMCGAGLVALAALTLGRLLLPALGLTDASRHERQMVALTLGFGGIAACCYLLLCAGVYRPWPVVLVIVGVFLAGAALAIPYEISIILRPAGIDKAWLAIACLALSFALVGALAPETEYDALWYHLNQANHWLQSGRAVDLIQEFPSLYPMTWELVYGMGLAMGGIVAAKLLHFVCLLVLAGIVAMTCRRYLPARSPYVAVALLVTAPTILWEATTAYNDLAVAMFASAGCYALARFAETGHSPWLTVSGLEFGLAASTKHLGLVVLAIAAAALTWHSWRRGTPYGRMIRNAARLGVLAVVLPLPWYIRAWRGSGNPFFPELYGIFGGGPAARWDETANQGLAAFKAHFGVGHDVASLVRLPWDATVHSALFGGALGPLWLILIPGCLVGRGSRRVAAVIAAGTLGYIALWASPISSFQLRFLVPIGGALALLAADGWHRVMDTGAGIRATRMAGVALVAVACLNLPPFMMLHEGDRIGDRGWLTHVMRTAPVAAVTGRETEAQYLARTVPSYRVWQYANAHLPADAAVLTFTGGDNLYSRRVRYPHDSVLARPAVWTATNDIDVLRTLHGLRIEYVIFDRRILPQLESDHLPIAGERMQRACVTLYEDGRYRLCQLPSVSGQSSTVFSSAGSGSPR